MTDAELLQRLRQAVKNERVLLDRDPEAMGHCREWIEIYEAAAERVEALAKARAAWSECAGRLSIGHRPGCAAVKRGRAMCDCEALRARDSLARLARALS